MPERGWGDRIAAERRAEEEQQQAQEPPETLEEGAGFSGEDGEGDEPEDTAARVDRLEGVLGDVALALQEQGRMIGQLAGLVQAQREEQIAAVPLAPPPAELVRELPEGLVQFASPFANYRIVLRRQERILVNGEPMTVEQEEVHFHNGIAQVDEATADALRSRPEFGEDYIEDPTAVPRMGPIVQTGPRSSGDRRPVGGRLAVRLPE
jgi:hypothetical protein